MIPSPTFKLQTQTKTFSPGYFFFWWITFPCLLQEELFFFLCTRDTFLPILNTLYVAPQPRNTWMNWICSHTIWPNTLEVLRLFPWFRLKEDNESSIFGLIAKMYLVYSAVLQVDQVDQHLLLHSSPHTHFVQTVERACEINIAHSLKVMLLVKYTTALTQPPLLLRCV